MHKISANRFIFVPMPQQLGNLIKKLIEKAGLDANDARYADLLSINATVGDETYNYLAGFVDSALSFDAAKNDSRLDAHFRQKTLMPLDSEIKKIMDEFGFDDELKNLFEAEKSTYKKTRLLAEKIKELEEKKGEAKSGDKAALQQEINKLSADFLKARKEAEEKINQIKEEANNQILDYAIKSELAAKPYADTIPEAMRISGAYNLLQQEMEAKGVKVTRTADNKLKLVKADDPGLNYIDNNREVSFGEFTDKLLAAHTMLKVSDPANPGKGATPIIRNGDGKRIDASSVQSFNEAQIAALSD